jgi:hypothetical protein
MRCQDFERLILESGDRELSREEQHSINDHLARCASCSGFREFWLTLQLPIQSSPAADLPPDLDDKVRLICHDAIRSRNAKRHSQLDASRESASVPWAIWAALSVLTVLTLAFLLPEILDFWKNQELTPGFVLALVLILQNALALFFVPVIVRRRQPWNQLDLGRVQ